MTRPMYACAGCEGEYVTPLAAALCCDVVYDKPTFQHSYDR